jgi:hypothetical protein
MGREARGWSFPNNGSKFWLNPPSGFRVMGVSFGGSDGGADLFHCGGQEAEERRGEEHARAQEFWQRARTRILDKTQCHLGVISVPVPTNQNMAGGKRRPVQNFLKMVCSLKWPLLYNTFKCSLQFGAPAFLRSTTLSPCWSGPWVPIVTQ